MTPLYIRAGDAYYYADTLHMAAVIVREDGVTAVMYWPRGTEHESALWLHGEDGDGEEQDAAEFIAALDALSVRPPATLTLREIPTQPPPPVVPEVGS